MEFFKKKKVLDFQSRLYKVSKFIDELDIINGKNDQIFHQLANNSRNSNFGRSLFKEIENREFNCPIFL